MAGRERDRRVEQQRRIIVDGGAEMGDGMGHAGGDADVVPLNQVAVGEQAEPDCSLRSWNHFSLLAERVLAE